MKTAIVTNILSNDNFSKIGAQLVEPLVFHHEAKKQTSNEEPAILDGDVKTLIKEKLECFDEEDAFFVADLGELDRQLRRWKQNLPRIEPFYAVKCNPDPVILKKMAAMGVGFDCASKNEINSMLSLGVNPDRIIYANPCKQASHIRFACASDVKMMTFDNKEELLKIKQHFPAAKLVLRIITDDSNSVCRLSSKFGASLEITEDLLSAARELQLDVIGVSFHVGSGCMDPNAFRDAVCSARIVFDQAERMGFNMSLLDVGGGFPGSQGTQIKFEEIANVLRVAVDEMFPPEIRVIAEPGRFFVSSAFTLAVHVTARRSVNDNGKESFMYYINDGVYGSFNCILFDHAVVVPKVLTTGDEFHYGKEQSEYELFPSSIWGPTCDSMDCITKSAKLPKLDIGDWLYFENMGAYTNCAASTFNGFKKSHIVYTFVK